MHADTKKYNNAQAPASRAICMQLAGAIDRALPDAENKVWHAHPVWFLDGNPIVGYSKLKDCVRLLFWSGQSFKAKGLKKEGTFKAAEARYTIADEIDAKQLQRWLAEARVVQWDYKNLIRRRGQLVRLRAGRPQRKGAKTVLLSGGNPQIAKADGNAPVRAYIDAMPGWKRDVGRQLDAIVVRSVPGVRKAVKWNSPFYGMPGRGWFLSFHVFARFVKVAFFRGSALRPLPPGPSQSQDTRYLDIREGEALDEAQFSKWVKQAATLPGWMASKEDA